jgi:hypothetical protein
MADLKAQGWYSASNHVHMNYGGDFRSKSEDLFLMAEAEDLDIIGDLVANRETRIPDHDVFGAGGEGGRGAKRVLRVNQECRSPFYGHISLINLTHLVYPFSTGYPGTALASLYPSNTDLFEAAKRQGGLGAYVHPFFGDRVPRAFRWTSLWDLSGITK